ncbi:MGH1-like glycoside hydrolase domain-containing protein [Nesterenkonia haasae]|uniref:MGH1-like glycoside hydrolase domain-containing protein n=1 Tax=Nesterenkonia haasae TaxID=2587813 RepID=UPI001391BD47|nr:hypothetical protein [Nesterenkonia haasae]NDK30289.1 hypothetical protein [Nesterenkonia haasae]
MSATQTALEQLRSAKPSWTRADLSSEVAAQIEASGVGFAAVGGMMEDRWHQALAELQQCIRPLAGSPPVLNEGGVYAGTWIESTGTINTEVLSRFAPRTATETFRIYATHQRADGLIPYKVTADGPAFSQIQIVTPLARSVWNHYQLHRQTLDSGADVQWLRQMYIAMIRYDEWLSTYRNTRGTGCVEAFCTFDTGHDLSPRFWFVPDRCFRDDAALCDPEASTAPFLAPDLTANVACQRRYLALIAAELEEDPHPWEAKAEASVEALFQHCYDETDGTFYDLDAHDAPVKVASDVLLRVLACEIGDADFFTHALERYVMNSAHFLSHYGFTTISLSDPRYDGDHTRNSWAGPVHFLTQLRAPHAFEHHGRLAELHVVNKDLLAALTTADRFPQGIDPWSGAAGFTSTYSPSILWMLDTVERTFGILPMPSGEVAFNGLAPTRLDPSHGNSTSAAGASAAAQAVAYSRAVAGVRYELAADDHEVVVFRNGSEHLNFPRGWRVTVNAAGAPTTVTCSTPRSVTGRLSWDGRAVDLTLAANEYVKLEALDIVGRDSPGFSPPRAN